MFSIIGRSASLFTLTALFATLTASHVSAQSNIVRIEEDWELHVVQPDEQLDAPQVSTMLLPFGDGSDVLLQIDWNHGTYPDFSRGGFQVRSQAGQQLIDSNRHHFDEPLYRLNETVRWTQVVQKVSDGYLFGVAHGTSETWGEFGGEATVVRFNAAAGGSLAAYSPTDSASNSGVTFAGNRVGWLTLKRVRIYDELGHCYEASLDIDAK